jgi:riboflavin synthase
MFTGIVERMGEVLEATETPQGRRLRIAVDWPDLNPGQSIAVNGCCLTVADLKNRRAAFDVIPETLEKTNLGLLNRADMVNLERSLRVGDRLDGHWVQGHIDGRAILLDSKTTPEETRLRLAVPADLYKFIIPKGSVTLDGVSLTVAAIYGTGEFEVALIPTTLQLTTLGRKPRNYPFNLEADTLSKTIVTWLERQAAPPQKL